MPMSAGKTEGKRDAQRIAAKHNIHKFDETIIMMLLSFQAKKKQNIGRSIMVVTSTKNQSPYGIECIRCNEILIAPACSKYVSPRHVRHAWSCERCGHQFETSDHLRFNAPFKARWKVPSLPLLVA
jgi:primosomal protein N'